MISAPKRRFHWASRLTTSRKLSKIGRSDLFTSPFYICAYSIDKNLSYFFKVKKLDICADPHNMKV